MMVRLKNESGFALILTLVITALMVAVVVEMIHQVYVDTSISRGFRDGQQASVLAESGVMAVKKALSQNIDPALLSSFLAQPLTDEVGSLEIKISDESGKININGLVNGLNEYDELIKNTLMRLTAPLKLTNDTWSNVLDSTADWIDTDNGPRTGGAETPYYRILKPAYSAHNGSLMTLMELSLVKGITPAMLDGLVDEKSKIRLRDCLTVYPIQQFTKSNINVNSAPKPVLMALDPVISESVAEQIINKRPFKGTGEFSNIKELDSVYRNSGSWGTRLSITSSLFRVKAVAKVKESVRVVEAVVSNGSFLSWQEY
jgi:general secretion pathway protein K